MATIDELKRQFPQEWLAVEVTSEGPAGPREGNLLHHSSAVDDVLERASAKDRKVYVTFAGPPLAEGYTAAF